ncbi:MAG: glycoside hydrolase family 3 C-terminal domain-containing protein [Fidelibacterota bacterium]|nr:MAG: glycoside hydrolase family 3 C-terminal domain-containing protein [Candidatus Neomarinimicrobiota bacterium]
MKPITEMTLEEKAGQLYIIGFNGIRMNDYLREIITDWKIGGIVFSVRNVENPFQVRELISEAQELAIKASGIPLIITINQEGGDRTCFLESLTRNPGSMAIGASGDPNWAYTVAQVVGTELKALGFNTLYMPVLDFSNMQKNAVLGIRSFGDDPEMVAEMGRRYIEGLDEAGLAATAKHFPGAGDSELDAHFETPVIDRTLEELEGFELIPFKAAIEAGVPMMMTCHCMFPNIDSNAIATVSDIMISKVAREKLGYDGIITSDAFGMHGLIDNYSPREAAVRAILAGADMILKRHGRAANYAILDALREALKSGRITEERVDISLKRILALKQKYCYGEQPDISTVIWNGEHIRKLEAMGEESVTLLRNEEGLLPLKLDLSTKVLMIMPDMLANASLDGITGDPAGYIIRGILSDKYSYSTDGFDMVYYGLSPYAEETEKVIQKADAYDILILASHRSNMLPTQGRLVERLFQSGKRVIWIALNTPYDIYSYPDAKTYICSYGDRLPQLKALGRIIAGEISPKGRLPVNIPGLHERGEGITGWN